MSKQTPEHPLRVLTANRLLDGAVVYLTRDGGWSPALDTARIADNEAGARGLARAAEIAMELQQVVGPYLIDLASPATPRRPVRLRERVRLDGPTVAFGQAATRREI